MFTEKLREIIQNSNIITIPFVDDEPIDLNIGDFLSSKHDADLILNKQISLTYNPGGDELDATLPYVEARDRDNMHALVENPMSQIFSETALINIRKLPENNIFINNEEMSTSNVRLSLGDVILIPKTRLENDTMLFTYLVVAQLPKMSATKGEIKFSQIDENPDDETLGYKRKLISHIQNIVYLMRNGHNRNEITKYIQINDSNLLFNLEQILNS